jgi:hypothetical protein
MSAPAIDDLPGFRRRVRVTPGPDRVLSELEDDLHCMAVELQHRDGLITRVSAEQDRAPWSTCAGAIGRVGETLEGRALAEVAGALGDKLAHCTHLYDLAVFGAAHAADRRPLVYDILISDPIHGRRLSELRRNGETVMAWAEQDDRLCEPEALAGLGLRDLRSWIEGLDPAAQEAAKLLRWGSMLARGRALMTPQKTDPTGFPPNCHTLQPQIARDARRVGEVREFSRGDARPLDRRPAPAAPFPHRHD